MRDQAALATFASGLHQDVFVGLDGLDELADLLLSNMDPAEKQAFAAWLAKAFGTLSRAEMRSLLNRANSSLLNRANSSIGFSSEAAYELLRAAGDRLGVAEAGETKS